MESVSDIENYILGLSPVVIDIIFVIIILAVGLLYARKGLYQLAATGLIIVLSFVIGIVICNMATEPVLDFVWEKYSPSVEASFDEKIDSIVNGSFNFSEELKSGWNSILENIGFDGLDSLKIEENPDIDYTDTALVENLRAYTLIKTKLMLSKILKFVIFGLSTAVFLLLLTFIKNMIDKIAKLPVVHWIDSVGGFLAGACGAVIVLLVIVRVSGLVGFDFFKNISEGTVLLNWLAQGDMNYAVELIKTFNIDDIKNIDFSAETQKIIESYNNPQLSQGAETISEVVQNLSTKDLENLINNIAQDIKQ